MSDKKIKCWSCTEDVSFNSIASNDGDCPKCNAEIDMYCIAEQLQRQNNELVARADRLEEAFHQLAMIYEADFNDALSHRPQWVKDALAETPKQSLKHIECKAVEKFANEIGVYDSAYDDQEYVEVPRYRIKEYIAELRQQSTNNGGDGDE